MLGAAAPVAGAARQVDLGREQTICFLVSGEWIGTVDAVREDVVVRRLPAQQSAGNAGRASSFHGIENGAHFFGSGAHGRGRGWEVKARMLAGDLNGNGLVRHGTYGQDGLAIGSCRTGERDTARKATHRRRSLA